MATSPAQRRAGRGRSEAPGRTLVPTNPRSAPMDGAMGGAVMETVTVSPAVLPLDQSDLSWLLGLTAPGASAGPVTAPDGQPWTATTAAPGRQMDAGLETRSPSPALRSLQKMGGLFDSGCADVDFLDEFASVPDLEQSLTAGLAFDTDLTTAVANAELGEFLATDSSDLARLFGVEGVTPVDSVSDRDAGQNLLLSPTDTQAPLDKMEPVMTVDLSELEHGADAALMELEGDMEFGEEFTDLTQLTNAILGPDAALYTESLLAAPTTTETLPALAPDTPSLTRPSGPGRRASKRRVLKGKAPAGVVKERVARAVGGGDGAVVQNHDHDDYTLKIKRPKMASVSSVADSGSESDVSAFTPALTPRPSPGPALSPGPATDDRYKQRRDKNNIASRRSRQTRKQKYNDMEDKVVQLEAQNREMTERIALMEELAKSLKQHLVSKMAAR